MSPPPPTPTPPTQRALPLLPTHLIVLLHGVAGNGGHLSGTQRARMRGSCSADALTHPPPQ
jgi:hypothetical protein